MPFSIELFGHVWAGNLALPLGILLFLGLAALTLAFPQITGWRTFSRLYSDPDPVTAAHAASRFTAQVSWTLGHAIRESAFRVEVLTKGVRLRPRPNPYRAPSVFLPWSAIASCTPDRRLPDQLDGARHTELRMVDGAVIVCIPDEAGDRVAAEWRLLQAPPSARASAPNRPGASTAS